MCSTVSCTPQRSQFPVSCFCIMKSVLFSPVCPNLIHLLPCCFYDFLSFLQPYFVYCKTVNPYSLYPIASAISSSSLTFFIFILLISALLYVIVIVICSFLDTLLAYLSASSLPSNPMCAGTQMNLASTHALPIPCNRSAIYNTISCLDSDWLCLILINARLESDTMSTLPGLTSRIQFSAI